MIKEVINAIGILLVNFFTVANNTAIVEAVRKAAAKFALYATVADIGKCVKNHPMILFNGYPGGWATPANHPARIISPESPPKTECETPGINKAAKANNRTTIKLILNTNTSFKF